MKHRQMMATALLLTMASGMMAQQAKHPATHASSTPAAKASTTPAGTLPVVMLSDLHFDPFYDPAKIERLLAAKMESDWARILSEPDSPGREAEYMKLKTACGLQRGDDSPWALVESSLKAAHAAAPKAAFVLNSGDLIAHEFPCKFRKLVPHATPEQYSEFASHTADFVIYQMKREFGAIPVFPALGNNDTGCGDYRESPNDFMMRSLMSSLQAIPHSDPKSDIPQTDSYSATMPGVDHGRVIVLQNVFQAMTYRGCDGKPDPAASEAELTWLRAQLAEAKEKHEHVWVVTHIPPGIDVYNTLTKKRDVCGKEDPVLFLGSNKLSALLEEFAPQIRLAVFAHTHMDEMRTLSSGKPGETVVAKLVPSVSPINGNYPAFTIGYIDPKTAELRDYRVFASDSLNGATAHWTEQYTFSSTYHRKAYTVAEIAPMLAAMRADRASALPESNAYESHFMVNGGLRSLAIRLVWPQYACALEHDTAAGFKACMCPATPADGSPR